MKQVTINYHDYKTYHSYTSFSDWYPHAFYMDNVHYPCSAAALIMTKAKIHGDNDMIQEIHDIMSVMHKFMREFLDTDSPRFWTRWDEQLVRLYACALKLDNAGNNDRFLRFCKQMYQIYRTKFNENAMMSLLLVSTGEIKMTELHIRGNATDWRCGDPILYLIYPDIAHIDNDASGACLTTLRDKLASV